MDPRRPFWRASSHRRWRGALVATLAAFFAAGQPLAWGYLHEYHFYVTASEASWCGLPDGRRIALTTEQADIDPETTPFHPGNEELFHFPQTLIQRAGEWTATGRVGSRTLWHLAGAEAVRGSPSAQRLADAAIAFSKTSGHADPVLLGLGLHRLQDSWSHEGFTPPFGHLFSGHRVDYPRHDPSRADQMARITWEYLDAWSVATRGKHCDRPPGPILAELAAIFRQPAESSRESLAASWQTQLASFLKSGLGSGASSLNREPRPEQIPQYLSALARLIKEVGARDPSLQLERNEAVFDELFQRSKGELAWPQESRRPAVTMPPATRALGGLLEH